MPSDLDYIVETKNFRGNAPSPDRLFSIVRSKLY